MLYEQLRAAYLQGGAFVFFGGSFVYITQNIFMQKCGETLMAQTLLSQRETDIEQLFTATRAEGTKKNIALTEEQIHSLQNTVPQELDRLVRSIVKESAHGQ
jgi:CRISPR/Cas system CMR subunit Cmr4 (Cas7 group RAMP superfamily)